MGRAIRRVERECEGGDCKMPGSYSSVYHVHLLALSERFSTGKSISCDVILILVAPSCESERALSGNYGDLLARYHASMW